MKKVVTLQFTSIAALWLFKGEVQPTCFELNLRFRIITCACTDKQLQLAKDSFHAIIIPATNCSDEMEKENHVA